MKRYAKPEVNKIQIDTARSQLNTQSLNDCTLHDHTSINVKKRGKYIEVSAIILAKPLDHGMETYKYETVFLDELIACDYAARLELDDKEGEFLYSTAHRVEAERIAKIKQNVWSSNENKFQIGREELQKKVWETPLYKIGIMYGVSGRTVKKYCNKFNISTPNRGYWAKKSGD